MKRLEQLKEIADESMAGLEAGPALRQRILSRAGGTRTVRTGRRWIAVVACCALVLAVGLPVGLNMIHSRSNSTMTVGSLGSGSAGRELATVDTDKATLTVTRKNAGSAQSILGDGLIRVNGRYYRQLKGIRIDSSFFGSSLGSVQEKCSDLTVTTTPIASTVISAGTEVYGVSGMSGTLVACTVDGHVQLFQRVTHAGNALVGGEGLADVLQLRGHVRAMSLSGVGIVEGSEAERLFGLLLSSASYDGSSNLSGKQVLIIELDNGAAVQLNVSGYRIGGCGVWECADFIDSFPRQ